MPEDHFGERVAERYDEWDAASFEPAVVDPIVDFLVDAADGGPALELGIGTGRIALPLARRGVRVYGIDLSAGMVARRRSKPGSEAIEVRIGDFATPRVDVTVSVAYLVVNTIMNLTTQAEQVACFANVAAHLAPNGRFVIEVGVPQLQRLPPGETVRAFDVSPSRVGFDEYDVASQGLVSHHYRDVDGRLEVLSVPFRYVWPAGGAGLGGLAARFRWVWRGELARRGRLAGMPLRERGGGGRREPFTSDSR